jgi:hypothetical protein
VVGRPPSSGKPRFDPLKGYFFLLERIMKTPEEIREEIREVLKQREELDKKHRRLVIQLGEAMEKEVWDWRCKKEVAST